MIFPPHQIFTPYPVTQATNLVFSEVSDTQLRVSATRGSGVHYLVVAKLTSSPTRQPRDTQTYTANSVFGSGSNLGNGNYVVAKGGGTISNILITGLTQLTSYTFFVYEFNSSGNGFEQYNVQTATDNPKAVTTIETPVTPSVQATNLVIEGIQAISMTRGNGQQVLTLKNEGGAINGSFLPVDGQNYTVGQNLGGGNIVIAIGTGSLFFITQLPYSTTVAFRAFEFNVSGGSTLYFLNTATGNPITHDIGAKENWYSYKNTPFLTRRNAGDLYTIGSREFSQLYPTADWIGSTHHHVWFVAEGDGAYLPGVDRTIRYKRALANDPTVKANWVPDSPVDSRGDTPSFLDSSGLDYPEWVAGSYDIGDRVHVRTAPSVITIYESTVNGNTTNPVGGSNWSTIDLFDRGQCWMMSVVEHGGNQYGVYVANRYPGSRYSVGIIVSTDDFSTFTRLASPIIPDSGSLSAYYCHVHPTKVGSYWYMFIQNFPPTAENHLYCLEIWRTSNDPTTSGWTGWTKRTGTTDQLSGRGLPDGAIDISTSWNEDSKYWAFISPNTTGQDGGYNAKRAGETAFKTTYPVGDKILLISWTDWEDFRNTFIIEKEIYATEQQTEIELRTWCPKRTFGGNDFFVGMGFLWRGQTALNGIQQMEPKNDGKIISRSLNTTGAVQVRNEIYPSFLKLVNPHQSFENDTLDGTPVQPKNVILDSNGTVVGSPKISFCNCIQPVSGGFVTFPNADFVYDANYLAVKVTMGLNTLTTSYGICGMDTDVGGGNHGWHIRKSSQYNVEIWVYGSDNVSLKRYRVSYLTKLAKNDSTLLTSVGFEFKNGTLKVRVDYDMDCTVTKVQDDSFTAMRVTDEPLRIGAIYPTTNNELYSHDVVGPFMMLSGVSNVTDDNWLNHNLICY